MGSLIATDDSFPCTATIILTVPSRQKRSVIHDQACLQFEESMSLFLYATNMFYSNSTTIAGQKKLQMQQHKDYFN
ncbi:hypothetical protein A2U01_0047807 [Trifolium medium]|uniref:Uncharacterized protein n=1 Tax=Trifolium medium TaxID=97028 RepID=A0A392QSL8_9FABA|nr:hypothetical protein [Trifolium medium]